jgi:hypothetical protein
MTAIAPSSQVDEVEHGSFRPFFGHPTLHDFLGYHLLGDRGHRTLNISIALGLQLR